MGGTPNGDGAGAPVGADSRGTGSTGSGFVLDGAVAAAYSPGMFNVASLGMPIQSGSVGNPSFSLTAGDNAAAPPVAPDASKALASDAKLEQLPNFSLEKASSADDANLIIKADGTRAWTKNPIEGNKCKVWVDDAARENPDKVLAQLKEAKTDLEEGRVAALNGQKATLNVPDSAKNLPEFMTAKSAVDAAAAEKAAADKAAADKAAAEQAEGDKEDTSGDQDCAGGGGGGGGGKVDGDTEDGPDSGPEGDTTGGDSAPRNLNGKGLVDAISTSANGMNPMTTGAFFGRAMSAGMYSAFSAIGSADADGDGKISPEEQAAYDERVKNFQKYQDEHPDEVKQFKDNMEKMGKDLDADSQKSMKDFSEKISNPMANKDSLIKFAGAAKLHEDATKTPSLFNETYAKKMLATITRDMPDLNKAIIDRSVHDLANTNKFKIDLSGPGPNADETAKNQYRVKQDEIRKELELNPHKF